MLKRVLQFTVALIATLAMMAIPASASMGGLSATVHQHGGVSAPVKHPRCHHLYKHKCHKSKHGSEEHKVVIEDSHCECAVGGECNPVDVEPVLEPGPPCAKKICVPVEEECPEKEEIAGPKG